FSNHSSFFEYKDISEHRRMKINYDLFNNIISISDFEYVCKPFGQTVGELPANFTNKDICSGKIKALLGMENKRSFSWRVIAVNDEAHTVREEHEFGMIRDYVVSEIMKPIRMEIEQKYQSNGNQLTPDQE